MQGFNAPQAPTWRPKQAFFVARPLGSQNALDKEAGLHGSDRRLCGGDRQNAWLCVDASRDGGSYVELFCGSSRVEFELFVQVVLARRQMAHPVPDMM